MNGYASAGALLEDLAGHGIYDVEIVHEGFEQFGFSYDEATDRLHYGDRSIRLGATSKEVFVDEMAKDPRGGIMDDKTVPGQLMVDALQLSRAIFQLLVPDQPVPSDKYHGRGKGYRANVAAILRNEPEEQGGPA